MAAGDRKHDTTPRAAWREPMVWLVAAIPAAAVIGTFALLYVASRSSGTDDAVADQVKRTAQVQVADLGPDAMARQRRLSAVVRQGADIVEVLPVNGDFDRSAGVELLFNHPARADLDRRVVLAPTKTGWRGNADIDLSHDWNVQLGPTDGGWRLQGRWLANQQAVYLQPAVEDGQ
jgi:hypothetical protein